MANKAYKFRIYPNEEQKVLFAKTFGCISLSVQGVSNIAGMLETLETLEKNGYIRRDPTKPRAIEIMDDSFQMVRHEMASIPVVGTVAAGQPILAQQNIESYFPIPTEFVPNAECFSLRVKGESMINVGIFDGDQIFVECCNTARNGDIVVAIIDDSVTLKRFFKEATRIRLQAENPDFNPIYSQDVKVLGKLSHIIREY